MNDEPRIDLHAHTIYSDGTFTPTELVEKAAEIGLTALAVTDHDTTDGLPEARIAGERLGVRIITGCEITTEIPTGIVHMLSYDFDTEDKPLQELLTEVRSGRETRNTKIFAKLRELKLPLEESAVRAFAHGQIIARPHFAMAMVEAGYVDGVQEAFRSYLHDGGPAYARAKMPSPEEAIRAVKGAGGVTVLAHPRSLKLGGKDRYRPVLTRFRDAGMTGIEVDHPSQNEHLRRMFSELADELGLIASGGSDFHGDAKPHILLGKGNGTIDVRHSTWERLAEHARS